ncbi:hypothetical protein [Amycolatopsis taiwanensis]|uniref:hypothetical protein n=1 Tax=Amycolatopsis taiwanensis TaxID=342230 RepID=UPI00048781C7|nr:hypothetical protein [Amycolatopsis taiwanensis]
MTRFQLSDATLLDELEGHIRGLAVHAERAEDETRLDAYVGVLHFLAGATNDKRGLRPGQPLASPMTCTHKGTVRKHPDPTWHRAGYGRCTVCKVRVPIR